MKELAIYLLDENVASEQVDSSRFYDSLRREVEFWAQEAEKLEFIAGSTHIHPQADFDV